MSRWRVFQVEEGDDITDLYSEVQVRIHSGFVRLLSRGGKGGTNTDANNACTYVEREFEKRLSGNRSNVVLSDRVLPSPRPEDPANDSLPWPR